MQTMRTMRTEDDALRRESASRLGATDSMKRECAAVRESLPRYLRGYVFLLRKIRIERHLRSCAVCQSACQALRMEINTQQLLLDVNPPEGLARYLSAGARGLTRLKKLLYRPLWLAAIAGIVVLVSVNVTSHRGDPEIENLEKSLPGTPASPPAPLPPSGGTQPAAPQQAPAVQAAPAVSKPVPATPAVEPFLITITPENEQTAVKRINEALWGHASLRGLHMSDSVREVSAKLSPAELLTLFSRLAPAGKLAYSRRRFDSFPADQPIPFVLKLAHARATVARPPVPAEPKVHQPAEAQAVPAPASAQTTSP